MTNLKSYDYCILRYMHDTVTRECINVGVVIYSIEDRLIRSKFRTTHGRLSAAFPDMNGQHFKQMMRHFQDELNSRAKAWATELDFQTMNSLEQVLAQTLTTDDSSLQWSKVASGLSRNLENEIDMLFARYVSRYDTPHARERRTENEMWRDFKRDLTEFKFAEKLQSKKFTVKDDEIEFKHALKNGIWHCIEPISFDLSSGDYLREKAHRWLGLLSSVQAAADSFKLYLLIGEPQDSSLHEPFKKALSILDKIPVDKEIFLESNSSQLAQVLSDKINPHEQP